MRLERTLHVTAAPGAVWNFFWDVPELASCIPGCTDAQADADGDSSRYTAAVTSRVGRFRVDFQLALEITDLVEGKAVTARVNGNDRSTRSMAIAAVQLELKPAASGESSIDLTIDLQVYGKLASMGHNIVERRAREILNEFADNVESRLSTVNPQTGAGDATVAESESAEPSFETRR